MRLHHFFLLTHGAAAAAVAMMMLVAIQNGSSASVIVSTALSLVTLGAASWYAEARICNGLSNLEKVVADRDECEMLSSGLNEIDQSADRIAIDAGRWESVAASNREQARDFQSMMFLLNRRGPDRPATSGQLRGLLAALGNKLHGYLGDCQRAADQMESKSQEIITGADSQSDTVIMTTAHLEQLGSSVELILANAEETESVDDSSIHLTHQLKTSIDQINSGLKEVRANSQSCEKKLTGLCDPVQQINGIIETITEVTSRTDLLALNASIEAMRAGEHGRQFAKVADEIRSLAEQATDATREITSLLDSIQLVTHESVHRVSQGREFVERHAETAAEAEVLLDQICVAVNDRSNRVRQIKETSEGQLQLVNNAVNALEKISEIAKVSRSDAESITWQSKSLLQIPDDFEHAVSRLRQCDGAVISETTDRADHVQQQSTSGNSSTSVGIGDDQHAGPNVAAPVLTTSLVAAE